MFIASYLLLVEGDEDDCGAEAAAGLREGPRYLEHGGQPRPVVVVAVGEAGGVPVRAHHDDAVLRRAELLPGVDADNVAPLVYLLPLLPELNRRWVYCNYSCQRSFAKFHSAQRRPLLEPSSC